MSLQEWERDVRNRQRNIVFPDTNLNEGRFYRNIVYGKAVFSHGQKFSLVIMPTYYLIIISIYLTGTISEVRSENKDLGQSLAGELWILLLLLGGFLFWTFLALKGLFSASPRRKRRRGYRQSSAG
jgi:hypothetical protein